MVAQISLFANAGDEFRDARQMVEDLNRGKRGHYNKVPKPKHTENKWEYMRTLYARLAAFFETPIPNMELKEDTVLNFADGRIRVWCFVYGNEE